MVVRSKGLGLEKNCAGEDEQHIQKTNPPHRNKTVTVKQ
jgi:hypothetical protein